jgi:hypothetical protein
MKSFTVTVGGQTRTIPGPDDATQEQAQAEAERQAAGKQTADLQASYNQPGFKGWAAREVGGFAEGARELMHGPAAAMGLQPGPTQQWEEKKPTTTGENVARFAGAILPGSGVAGRFAPMMTGALEGSGAPADSNTQRAINTGIGAIGGAIPGMPKAAGEAIDHLAGMGIGGLLGHGVGGPLSGLASIWGARLGNQMSHYAPIGTYARNLLSRFPPSVVARMLTDAGYPVSKILGQEYDYLGREPGGGQQN